MDEKTTRYYDEIMSEMDGVKPTPDQLEKLARLLYARDKRKTAEIELIVKTEKYKKTQKEYNDLLQGKETEGIDRE